MGLIQFEDVEEIFGYYIVRVYNNEAVKKYRQKLRDWVKQRGLPRNITFPNFEALVIKLEQIEFNRRKSD